MAEVAIDEVRGNTFLSGEGVSCPRLRQGLEDLEQSYGASPHDLNLSCLIAAASGDDQTSRELFERIGENWDAAVWRSHEEFRGYRDWARTRQLLAEEDARVKVSVGSRIIIEARVQASNARLISLCRSPKFGLSTNPCAPHERASRCNLGSTPEKNSIGV